MSRNRMFSLICSLALLTACTQAPENSATEVKDAQGSSLGSVAIADVCSTEAQTQLRRGMALFHSMTYGGARQEFAAASEIDSTCVLAKWGEALTLFHPLWPDVPTPAELQRGNELLSEARAMREVSKLEDAYLSAAEAYFTDAENYTESERLVRYAQAWEEAAESFPRDIETRLMHSLSMIAIAPASENRLEMQERASNIAKKVLAEVPDHPGALHYIIHANDLPQLANDGLLAARKYGAVAPENSHALHMTSHIFTRVGSWEESIDYNTRAAALAFDSPMNGSLSIHYLHASDYLIYAHLQRGDDESAAKVWNQMARQEGPIYNHAASAYAYAAVPARMALERQDWAGASELRAGWPSTIKWEQYPHLEAIIVFAGGMGAARTGQSAKASEAMERLEYLQAQSSELPGQYDWGTQVGIQKLALRAWIEFESGDRDEALSIMIQASELEATTTKNPVTPGAVLPAAEMLGDMLIELDQPEEAIQAYALALSRTPNRLNSLYGSGRAAEMSGNAVAAGEYFAKLVEITTEESSLKRVEYARNAVGGD